MENNRKGENGSVPYRTGRFFTADSMWYFASREGVDHGPYPNKSTATTALSRHLDDCRKVEDRFNRTR